MLCTQVADGPVEVLVDPMAIDPSGLTTLDAWQPDKEGRLLAYQLSAGGDEESLLRVLDVATGSVVDGPIDRCRYSNVAWLPGGKAFYYTRRLPPSEVPPGESQYHRRVYLHQVGTPAEEDVLIFGTGRDKTDYYYASVSRDGRWLFLSASRGTAPRNDLWLADLSSSDPVITGPAGGAGRGGRADLGAGGARRADCTCSRTWTRPGDGSRWPIPGPVADPRELAGPDRRGSRGGAARLRDPGRAGAGAAGPGGHLDQARAERDQRARPGHGFPAGQRLAARPRHRGRAERAARGRARGVVRVHGLHHAAAGAAVRRPRLLGAHLGYRAGERAGAFRDRAAGDVPVRGRHPGADAGHQRCFWWCRRRPGRPAAGPADRVRRLRHQPHARVFAERPGLGGGGRRVRGGQPARRQRGGRGVAPRRDARSQAERLRRFPRCRADPDPGRVDDARSSWPSRAGRTAGCWSARR